MKLECMRMSRRWNMTIIIVIIIAAATATIATGMINIMEATFVFSLPFFCGGFQGGFQLQFSVPMTDSMTMSWHWAMAHMETRWGKKNQIKPVKQKSFPSAWPTTNLPSFLSHWFLLSETHRLSYIYDIEVPSHQSISRSINQCICINTIVHPSCFIIFLFFCCFSFHFHSSTVFNILLPYHTLNNYMTFW